MSKLKPSPSLKPKVVRGSKEHAWWYEDEGGIEVVHEPEDRTKTLRLTWGELLKAAKRCGRIK